MTVAARSCELPGSRLGVAFRALRLPFLTASVGPYLVGALLVDGPFRPMLFVLGLGAVVCCHLSANLINDVADDASGADAVDPEYHGFFGGSKLIQAGRVPAVRYRAAGVGLGVAGALCVCGLAGLLGRAMPLWYFAGVLLLAWSYSQRPLRLGYRYLGELTIFVLFGPATVVGAAAIQRGELASGPEWLVSLPLGLLTAAILVSNEVPDAETDAAAGKRSLVTLLGARRGWAVYLLLSAMAWGMLAGLVRGGLLGWGGWLGLLGVPAGLAAAWVLRKHWRDKRRLHVSSLLAILVQALMAAGCIAGALT